MSLLIVLRPGLTPAAAHLHHFLHTCRALPLARHLHYPSSNSMPCVQHGPPSCSDINQEHASGTNQEHAMDRRGRMPCEQTLRKDASCRPQVLPPSMLLLADTRPDALVAALEAALARAPAVDRASQHKQARPARAYHRLSGALGTLCHRAGGYHEAPADLPACPRTLGPAYLGEVQPPKAGGHSCDKPLSLCSLSCLLWRRRGQRSTHAGPHCHQRAQGVRRAGRRVLQLAGGGRVHGACLCGYHARGARRHAPGAAAVVLTMWARLWAAGMHGCRI